MKICFRISQKLLISLIAFSICLIGPNVAKLQATIRIPNDVAGPPYVLDQAGETCVLTQDISAPGTAIVILAPDITLDLSGFTVTYNTEPSITPVFGLRVGTTDYWLNMGPDNYLKFTNGTIVQGNGASAYSHAIYTRYSDPKNVEISYLNITIHGDNCKAIQVDWAYNSPYFTIHHNTITSNVQVCTNRHAFDSYAMQLSSVPNATIYDNTIVGGQGGIALGSSTNSSIYRNDISHRGLSGNCYGILLWNPLNVEVYGNYIHPENGCGIAAGDWYRNVLIHNNNLVDIKLIDPTGDSGGAYGMKFRTYPDSVVYGLPPGNLKVYNNTITAVTGPGLLLAGGLDIIDSHDDLNNEYFSNNINVYTIHPTKRAAGIMFAGGGAPNNSGTKIYNNTVISNNINIDFSTHDGRGTNNVGLISNTLIKGDSPLNYHTIDMGYWRYASKGHVLLDTRTENGASVHDVYLNGGDPPGDYDYSLYIKWYLDVTVIDDGGNPVSGATVNATAIGGATETVSKITDASGKARLELTEYYRYGITYPPTSNYDNYTPHSIIASFGDQAASVDVYMEESKEITLILGEGLFLNPIGNKEVFAGEELRFQVSAIYSGGSPLTYTATNLPPGATFENRVFSWIPTEEQIGTYQVHFEVADGELTDSEDITITVEERAEVNSPPVLSPIGDKEVDEGKLLEFMVFATDPDGDNLTYSASGLPGGATFENRRFSWRPGYDDAGTYDVTFTVDDGRGGRDSEIITIMVNDIPSLEGEGFASDLNRVKAYPNPYRGNKHSQITFNNLTANVKIRIYSLTGELVKEISEQEGDKAYWDVKNKQGEAVASGIYIYYITNPKGQEKKGKLAIIR